MLTAKTTTLSPTSRVQGQRAGTTRIRKLAGIAAVLSVPLFLTQPISTVSAQILPCSAPTEVCDSTDLVVSVNAGNITGSAIQIEAGLFVTARHVVRTLPSVTLLLKGGRPMSAAVIPTSYPGDLALLSAPDIGNERPPLPQISTKALRVADPGPLYAVSSDPRNGAARVSPAGRMISAPAAKGIRPRLYHSTPSTFGDSGGALMDASGRLVGLIIAGGEGRNEAIPPSEIAELRRTTGGNARIRAQEIGRLYEACMANLGRTDVRANEADALARPCVESGNRQLIDAMGQTLGTSRLLDRSIDLFQQSLERDENALNARVGLVATQIAKGDYSGAVPHVERLLQWLPEDLGVLRQAVPVAKWAPDPALQDRVMQTLNRVNPSEAERAKGFFDADVPRPAGQQ